MSAMETNGDTVTGPRVPGMWTGGLRTTSMKSMTPSYKKINAKNKKVKSKMTNSYNKETSTLSRHMWPAGAQRKARYFLIS
jgi:hypothetical protein